MVGGRVPLPVGAAVHRSAFDDASGEGEVLASDALRLALAQLVVQRPVRQRRAMARRLEGWARPGSPARRLCGGRNDFANKQFVLPPDLQLPCVTGTVDGSIAPVKLG